jgi:hypothetical protein
LRILKEHETILEYKNMLQEVAVHESKNLDILNVSTMVAGLQTVKQIMPDMLATIERELFETGAWKRPQEDIVKKEILKPMIGECYGVKW